MKSLEDMLRTVYLPKVTPGSQANGHWELTMAEAMIAIGVFLDDRAVFDRGVAMWRGQVPASAHGDGMEWQTLTHEPTSAPWGCPVIANSFFRAT